MPRSVVEFIASLSASQNSEVRSWLENTENARAQLIGALTQEAVGYGQQQGQQGYIGQQRTRTSGSGGGQ